jgi:Glycosyl hydrolase catalytic core
VLVRSRNRFVTPGQGRKRKKSMNCFCIISICVCSYFVLVLLLNVVASYERYVVSARTNFTNLVSSNDTAAENQRIDVSLLNHSNQPSTRKIVHSRLDIAVSTRLSKSLLSDESKYNVSSTSPTELDNEIPSKMIWNPDSASGSDFPSLIPSRVPSRYPRPTVSDNPSPSNSKPSNLPLSDKKSDFPSLQPSGFPTSSPIREMTDFPTFTNPFQNDESSFPSLVPSYEIKSDFPSTVPQMLPTISLFPSRDMVASIPPISKQRPISNIFSRNTRNPIPSSGAGIVSPVAFLPSLDMDSYIPTTTSNALPISIAHPTAVMETSQPTSSRPNQISNIFPKSSSNPIDLIPKLTNSPIFMIPTPPGTYTSYKPFSVPAPILNPIPVTIHNYPPPLPISQDNPAWQFLTDIDLLRGIIRSSTPTTLTTFPPAQTPINVLTTPTTSSTVPQMGSMPLKPNPASTPIPPSTPSTPILATAPHAGQNNTPVIVHITMPQNGQGDNTTQYIPNPVTFPMVSSTTIPTIYTPPVPPTTKAPSLIYCKHKNLFLRGKSCGRSRPFIGKKGFGIHLDDERQVVAAQLLEALDVYWNYGWHLRRSQVQPSTSEFIPMTYNGAQSSLILSMRLRNASIPSLIANNTVRFLLGFNEPDSADQAAMNVSTAIDRWTELEKLDIPLISPSAARVKGPWMKQFVGNASSLNIRIDYIGVHSYGGANVTRFQRRMASIYQLYGIPLVITEFACPDWDARNMSSNRNSPSRVLDFMKQVLPWMEKTDWILGYSWFSFNITSPIGWSSALFDINGNLTAAGRYYKSVRTDNIFGNQSIVPDPDIH